MIWELTDNRKVNYTAIIFSVRVQPKSRLLVYFCRIVPKSIVRPALNGNITELDANFFNDNRDDDYVFYISATNFKRTFIYGW